jgi:hypothetical protein
MARIRRIKKENENVGAMFLRPQNGGGRIPSAPTATRKQQLYIGRGAHLFPIHPYGCPEAGLRAPNKTS